MKVYLVRHADAGDREAWTGPDVDRPLNERGWRQARGLVQALGDAKFDDILSSPYLRCVQTVQPLAEARVVEIKTTDVLAEGSRWRSAFDMILASEAPAVMCSQGDIIAAIVDDMARTGIVGVGDARWAKGSTWVLRLKRGRITKASYIPPPA